MFGRGAHEFYTGVCSLVRFCDKILVVFSSDIFSGESEADVASGVVCCGGDGV